MRLRDYQERAVSSVLKEWEEHSSTLVVAATGTGKTQIFSEVIRRMQPCRALVLAHREELIWQAVKRVEGFGLDASVEMAELSAENHWWGASPVVVSTIQTQIAGRGRMRRFDPFDFNLLVIDEAHHATSPSYRRVIDYYRKNSDLKILGVTATPDRADEQALGQVFESVAFDYEILDAIEAGWLVPVGQQLVTIEGLDFSGIRTTAGDLNGADLAAVMEAEKNLHGIVSATLDIIGGRRTLVFAVTVKQAERYAEIFNRHRPGAADWVCGKTPKDQRHETFRKFGEGATQILVNVGVATEGYDNPGVEVVVMARPTKSRCLYSQMVGRSTRPLPGVVDGLPTEAERRGAIAQSGKPSCLVIDFVGNAGRHKLMTAADILGGKVSEQAVQRVLFKAASEGRPVDVVEALNAEEQRLRAEAEERRLREAARRAHVIGRAQFSAREINPFDAFQLEPARVRGWDAGRQYTEKQAALLRKQGIDPSRVPYPQGVQLIAELCRRWDKKLCTIKQANLLRKHGYETKDLAMAEASRLIDALAKNNWRRPDAAH
ncbi:MAG TPA: DEAD/DEAH box helicase [Pyrinomonadaceae bacterium]|nr:DEAD/DEAH box helicase [Pyrinomonadaceae bacterium]